MVPQTSSSPIPHERGALRKHLLTARAAWQAGPAAQAGEAALERQLLGLLDQLEPLCLGLYWPLEGEFNAAGSILAHAFENPPQLALPYAYKGTGQMVFRRWDGAAPTLSDECGIPSSAGAALQPDVVLVPCVGFTREGYRLGYGGGYFDRWLEAHPGVTSIGLAWSGAEAQFAVEPHDQALTLVLTESELIAP